MLPPYPIDAVEILDPNFPGECLTHITPIIVGMCENLTPVWCLTCVDVVSQKNPIGYRFAYC